MATFGAATSNAGSYPNPNNDYEVPQPINDGIQDLAWSPTANVLVAGSWDNYVRCWDVQQSGTQLNAVPKAQISHDGPVLCTAFSGDGSTVFSGSCDKTAKMWTLNGPAQGQQIAAHEGPIKCISAIPEASCVATASWDKTLKYWDTRSPSPMGTLQLSERAYAMDVRHPLLVVGTADKQIHIVDIRKPTQIYKSIASNLKFQTKSVACFPDTRGFVVASVEGRVAIQHVEDKDKSGDYTFRCHRENNTIYPVTSLSFNPLGTISTTGSDGTYAFWDLDGRQKLKSFGKCNQSISAGKFNARGDIFAYAVSYDWTMGAEKYNPSQPSVIRLHSVQEAEVQPKKRNARR